MWPELYVLVPSNRIPSRDWLRHDGRSAVSATIKTMDVVVDVAVVVAVMGTRAILKIKLAVMVNYIGAFGLEF